MLSIESLILITGVLLLLGIASNKFSARMGVPVLFVFLVVGMLAGSEGIGGIEFENYALAHGIGTVALCLILFDGGLRTLRPRLSSTLEVESGSNDPMAIFLTVGLIQLLSGAVPLGLGLLVLFLNQIVLGTIVGVLVGLGGVWLMKHIRLEAAGLYPVLATALGLFSFGFAAAFGGSGFLAVYLTGDTRDQFAPKRGW